MSRRHPLRRNLHAEEALSPDGGYEADRVTLLLVASKRGWLAETGVFNGA